MDKNFNKVVSLTMVQDWLIKHNIDGLLVRATDKYFNEYVPKSISIRYQVSGFDGSMGDVIITKEHGHLFIDGRYALQAKQQALPQYRVLAVNGAPHAQHFEVECIISELPMPTYGKGESRRRAEQEAAAQALFMLYANKPETRNSDR